jgi:hypothetical protein
MDQASERHTFTGRTALVTGASSPRSSIVPDVSLRGGDPRFEVQRAARPRSVPLQMAAGSARRAVGAHPKEPPRRGESDCRPPIASVRVALLESSRHRRATSGSVGSDARAYPDDGLGWSASTAELSGAYPTTCAKSQTRLYWASPPRIGSSAIAGRSAFRGQRRRTGYRASPSGPRRGGWRRSDRGCSTCRSRPQSGHQGSRARRSAARSKAFTGPSHGRWGWPVFGRSRRRAGSHAR